jgi:hypothetical protein
MTGREVRERALREMGRERFLERVEAEKARLRRRHRVWQLLRRLAFWRWI